MKYAKTVRNIFIGPNSREDCGERNVGNTKTARPGDLE